MHFPQRLKPVFTLRVSARLKPCPDEYRTYDFDAFGGFAVRDSRDFFESELKLRPPKGICADAFPSSG